MDQNHQDGNGPMGADFVGNGQNDGGAAAIAAAVAAARAVGGHAAGRGVVAAAVRAGVGGGPGAGGLGAGGPGAGRGGGQNQRQQPLAPGGLAAVNQAINNVQLQLQLQQYDHETLVAEGIMDDQAQ